MLPREAIEKAIEGGWANKEKCSYYDDFFHWEFAALDPSFWQSLGKTLGWNEHDGALTHFGMEEGWRFHAIRFYDLILTDGDTKVFWDEVLQ